MNEKTGDMQVKRHVDGTICLVRRKLVIQLHSDSPGSGWHGRRPCSESQTGGELHFHVSEMESTHLHPSTPYDYVQGVKIVVASTSHFTPDESAPE